MHFSRLFWWIFRRSFKLAALGGVAYFGWNHFFNDNQRSKISDFASGVYDRLAERFEAPIKKAIEVVELPVDSSLDDYVLAGAPIRGNRITLLKNIGYVVAYDELRDNPAWVAYRLNHGERVKGAIGSRLKRFRVDGRTKSRVTHDFYTGSGYHRGHLAPNLAIALYYGREAQLETFLMSNIAPQTAELNTGLWRDLEMLLAKELVAKCHELWVITGPVYIEQEEMESGVDIPAAYFKVIADFTELGDLRLLAFVFPQTGLRGRLEDYLVSVDTVEYFTGLNFFSELSVNEQVLIEEKAASHIW